MAAATAEMRARSDEQLVAQLAEAREALFNLRFQHASGALEPTHQMGARRREIAQILTIMRERELTDA